MAEAASLPSSAAARGGWTRSYEVRAVAVLSCGFGLVGLDRFIILPLQPAMMKDLHLGYQDIGVIASAFSVAWGVAALITGRLSDRFGRRAVLIPSILVFSLLAGASGLAAGLLSLIAVRVLMGLAEGAYTPASIAATTEASKPTRRGLNLGIQQNLYAILGLGLGPVLATQLLTVLPSWRWVFVAVSIPGLILVVLASRWLRDTQGSLQSEAVPRSEAGWRELFRHRNVPLAAAGMCCMLTSLLVATTLAPSYLVDVLHLDVGSMGWVLSGLGLGGFVGQMILPALSDWTGRKPVVIGCYLGALASLGLFLTAGANPAALFALLFMFSFFNNSMICLNVGPVTGEAAPAALTASATGVVVGVGEALGGGFSPALAGFVAAHYGLVMGLCLALAGLAVGFVLSLFLRETRPVRRHA